jgi:phosphoribosylanthranilate isomerase
VKDLDEALLLVECDVDWIGLPLRLAHHRPDLEEPEAAALIAAIPPHAIAVLITYLDRSEDILELTETLGINRVQLHGPVSASELEKLQRLAPTLTVIKSLIVCEANRRELEQTVAALSPFVDAFITDTFDPRTGACGATGKIHDWKISRGLVECSPRPVILAGGLTPANVRAAIETVKPAGVDAHSGLEDLHGRKDKTLVRAFVTEARSAFARTSGGSAA